MAHPGVAATHDINRKKVCAPCGRKVKPNMSITGSIRASMERFYPIFNIDDPHFPTSICGTCRIQISKADKDISLAHMLPEMPKYQDLTLLKETRNVSATSAVCYCYICLKARSTAHTPPKTGRGKARKLDPNISKGLFAAKEDEPIDSETPTKTPNPTIKTCGVCLQSIGKGISHVCKASNASTNLVKALEMLPDKVSDQVASTILCNKASTSSGSSRNAAISLTTKSKPTRVLVNPSESSKPVVTHESLDNLQAGVGNLSNTKMKGVANWCRTNFGRNCIKSGYKEHLTTKSTHLKDLYHLTYVNLTIDKNKTSELRPVVYANSKELVEKVCVEREYDGNPNVIITIDGGGGFFKVCATILPNDYNWNDDTDNSETGLDEIKPKPFRSTYTEGGTLKEGKLTGVKRLVVLALVPEIFESNSNFKVIFDLIKLNDIEFKIVSDYKAMLIALGLQTSRSSWPCPQCLIPLRHFDDYFNKEGENQPRTFGMLSGDHKKFTEELKSNTKLAKQCHSTVNKCLIDEDPEVEVLEKYVLPELHSLLGFLNHLFWVGLCPLLGREKALIWPSKLYLIPKGYHGTTFEGNQCRALIANADKLRDPDIYDHIHTENEKDQVKDTVERFITCIKCFDKIITNSFSSKQVDINIVESLVEDFKLAYKQIGISVTPKVHGIFDHLLPTLRLSYLKGCGLGVCTEQAGESFHHHFKEYFWKKRKISSLNNPDFGNSLLAAVVECASKAL